ncbi:DUF421 domain-containing protein [Paenibacillus alkalitolerans]|uniref:DUF421 domain-containing protein n=1 Tax=Paenibacillus alkalitolerans TaxID=2799335 RepID=UPI0018F42A96|nr:DUF421 domain-containing protein [Paenibacillus alkalitolerans]
MPEFVIILIRSISGYIFLLILARLMRKKQVSQLTFFDYIVGISIGSIAAELSFNPDIRMSNFYIGMFIWGFLTILISIISLKSYRFRILTGGSPTVLIENGKILEKNLKKENLTVDELMIYLRRSNAFNLSDVEYAVMETNGFISVMKKSDAQPLTPKDMGLVVEMGHHPHLVIIDGNVMERSLSEYGYSKEWLLGEIMKQGAKGFSEVFLAQIDSKGNVYVDLYNDVLKMPQIKQKMLAAANIKRLKADLQNFSLQTGNEEAKKMYQGYAKQMDRLFDDLSLYLKE